MNDGVHRKRAGVPGTWAPQVASFVAAAGVLLAVALGSAGWAGASTGHLPTAQESGETQTFLVGGLAFVLMVGAAGGVLWFTARRRKRH